jgi:hypothetical protein
MCYSRLPFKGSAWKAKNKNLIAASVLAVSAQKRILRSIWTGLGQIHMSIFAVGRNCTGEQNAILLSEISHVRSMPWLIMILQIWVF